MKVKRKNLSEKEINEIVIAQAENENAWSDIEYLKERAIRGSREKFEHALSKISKAEPDEQDKIE